MSVDPKKNSRNNAKFGQTGGANKIIKTRTLYKKKNWREKRPEILWELGYLDAFSFPVREGGEEV